MKENELRVFRSTERPDAKVNFDYYYQLSRNITNWDEPQEQIREKIKFLKQFKCVGLSYAIEENLRQLVADLTPDLIQIRKVEIQDFNDNREFQRVVRDLYNSLRGPIENFGETTASKFMHMICPNLVPMSDSIIRGYMLANGVMDKDFPPGTNFIRLMRFYCDQTIELIDDVMANHNLSREEAINYVKDLYPFVVRSIPRLLDKHYYWIAQYE